MISDGQLISVLSHTIGSIGQVLKHKEDLTDEEKEIQRIYKGYITLVNSVWKND